MKTTVGSKTLALLTMALAACSGKTSGGKSASISVMLPEQPSAMNLTGTVLPFHLGLEVRGSDGFEFHEELVPGQPITLEVPVGAVTVRASYLVMVDPRGSSREEICQHMTKEGATEDERHQVQRPRGEDEGHVYVSIANQTINVDANTSELSLNFGKFAVVPMKSAAIKVTRDGITGTKAKLSYVDPFSRKVLRDPCAGQAIYDFSDEGGRVPSQVPFYSTDNTLHVAAEAEGISKTFVLPFSSQELENFFNLNLSQGNFQRGAPSEDYDGDGVSNQDEVKNSTNPRWKDEELKVSVTNYGETVAIRFEPWGFKYYCSMDSSTAFQECTNYDGGQKFSSLSQGTHTVYAYAIDGDGYKIGPVVSTTFTVSSQSSGGTYGDGSHTDDGSSHGTPYPTGTPYGSPTGTCCPNCCGGTSTPNSSSYYVSFSNGGDAPWSATAVYPLVVYQNGTAVSGQWNFTLPSASSSYGTIETISAGVMGFKPGSQVGQFTISAHNPSTGVTAYGYLRTYYNGGLDTSFASMGRASYVQRDTGNVVMTSRINAMVGVQGTQGVDRVIAVGEQQNGAYKESVVMMLNYEGSKNISFNSTGVKVINVSTLDDSATSVALASDGSIYVAGTAQYDRSKFYVVKLNMTGAFDTSFGSSGITEIDFGSDSRLYKILMQSDGKLVLVGTSNSGTQLALARVSPTDGALDTSFGGSSTGMITQALSETLYTGTGINGIAAQLDNNNVVIAGSARGSAYSTEDVFLQRFTADGVPDTTLNGGNTFFYHQAPYLTTSEKVVDLSISGGNFVIGAQTASSFLFMKFDPSDLSVAPLNNSVSFGGSVAAPGFLLNDGSTFLMGGTYASSPQKPALAKFMSDGTLVSSYGDASNGKITPDTNAETITSAVKVKDGRMFLGGSCRSTESETIETFCIVRVMQ